MHKKFSHHYWSIKLDMKNWVDMDSCSFTAVIMCMSFLGPYPHMHMIFKQLKMEGFLVSRWENKNEESLKRMLTWMQEVHPHAWLILTLSQYSYLDNDAVSLDLAVYRKSWSVRNMSLLGLKTCLLRSWGCCRGKTLGKPSLKSDVKCFSGLLI